MRKTLFNRLLKNVMSAGETRRKSAKKRSLHPVNEHSEPICNAVSPSAIVFQQPVKKALVCLLFLMLAQGLLVNDFAFIRKGGTAGNSGPCVLSFDVCGHGNAAGAFDGMDFTAAVPDNSSFTPSFDKSFPPSPDEAVATAEAGETEKPPKA